MNDRPEKNALIAFILLLFFLVLCPVHGLAQDAQDVHATGSNSFRYGTGSTTDQLNNPIDKQYFEEIADARIFFQNFQLGLRYEMDDPSEVGRSFQGPEFRRRWLAYKKDDVDIQAGDVSALFGRGLAVNLFESRPLNYDSWLDGVFGKGEMKIPKSLVNLDASLAVKGVGGIEDFYPIDTTQNMMHISARAGNAEFGFFKKKLVLGATFLNASTSTNQTARGGLIETTTTQVNQPDFYADLNSGQFEAFVEWTENRTHVNQFLSASEDTNHIGHAGYGSLSYSNSVVGLTFDYKNYSYFLHNPGDLYSSPEDVFGKLPISSPPEVYKDFTFTEITRTTHAVNFDDELGYQLEADITAIPSVSIDIDGAASSSHDKYDASGNILGSTSVLPKFGDLGYYPFWEAYIDAEWDFDPATELNFVKLAIHRRSDVIAYVASNPGTSDFKWSTTIAGKVQYETTPNQSFLGILEHQWEYDGSLGTLDKRRLNELLTLQYSINPTLNFGGVFDYAFFYANGPITVDTALFDGWSLGKLHHLPELFIGLRLGEAHSLLMSYGAERGGLNCTGGICRVVPPFDGLRFSLTSQF